MRALDRAAAALDAAEQHDMPDNWKMDGETHKALSHLARSYLAARYAAEAAKKVYQEAAAKEEQLESELIQQFQQQGVQTLKLGQDDKSVLVASICRHDYRLPPEADETARAAVLAWVRRCHGGDLIKESIAWQSFSAWCRDRVAMDRPLHKSVVSADKHYISVWESGGTSS